MTKTSTNSPSVHVNRKLSKQVSPPTELTASNTQKIRSGFMKKAEVLRLTGWSNSTLYNRIASKEFRRPVSTGPRSVAWPAHEVYFYLEQCVAERDRKDGVPTN